MELKNGPVSVLRLISGSLQAANQAFGSVIVAIILVLLFCGLLTAIIFLSYFISPVLPVILQIPLSLAFTFIGLLFPLAIIQILAAKLEKTGMSASEALTSSIVPAFYSIISSLILSVPAMVVLFAACLSKSALVITLVYAAIFFAYIPFMFLQPALVLRQQGPISAIKYAWEVGSAFYTRILLIFASIAAGILILCLGVFCVVKAAKPEWFDFLLNLSRVPNEMLPFYLGSSFASVSKPLLIAGAVIAAALYVFVFLVAEAFLTALFLNLDYSLRIGDSREMDSIEIPTAAQPVQQPVPATAAPKQVSVEQEAIHTESLDENTVRHLQQVYNPQEHLDRAIDQDEDRMPTILFDEDMMKQLAENEKQMRERKERAQQQDDDTPDSIKMSDKTL